MPREIQTAVQIANMALRIMQASAIESFDDETLTAQTIRLYYNVVLRQCLSSYPWAFCKKEWELAQLPASPLPFWLYAYRLPVDFVDIRWVRSGSYNSPTTRPPGRDVPSYAEVPCYEVTDGNVVCCNYAAPVFAAYTYEAPVELYPHYFIDLLVSVLVEELSAVFGYNLVGQDHYKGRIYGPNGKFSAAIQQERRQHPPMQRPMPGRLTGERNW
jgi:hypothetical protein